MKKDLLIIKISGNIIDDSNKLDSFLKDFAALKQAKILVHGGGKIATNLSKKLQIPTELIEGRRITTNENLEVVTMVYAGLINKQISAKLQGYNCNALGLSGSDANCISAKKRPITPIDYGWVGDINFVNTKSIQLFLNNGLTPVFSAICHNNQGQLLNTNADTIAAEIAIAMSKTLNTQLIYCFEKNGVLKNENDDSSLIETISPDYFEQLKAEGIINKGMLPKLTNSFYALKNDVSTVQIGSAQLLANSNLAHTQIKL